MVRIRGVAFTSAFALVLGAWVFPASADDAPREPGPRREIAFDYGLRPELIQLRDDALRPLRWTGGTLGLVLGLDVYRESGRHRADVDLAFGPVFNRYGHVGVVFEHQRATGQLLDRYAASHVFAAAGIERFVWLHHADGLAYGAWGLFLVPRDFLRLGQVALSAARHESGAVVGPAWIDEATSFQVKPDDSDGFDYGYYWWLAPDQHAFTANGHGGQYAYVVPALDLVTVITADPNSSGDKVGVRLGDARSLVNTLSTGAK